MNSGSRTRLALLCFAALTLRALAAAPKPADPPRGSTPKEDRVGRQEARAIAAHFVFITDKAAIEKLMVMVQALAKVSERPDIKYDVHVVDESYPNAFTIPGGHIYVTKGLLDFVQSDHELAAVLAHEIGHNTKMHGLRMLAEAKKLQPYQMLSLLAMALGGGSGRAVGAFSQYLFIGILNGYGVEMEKEADDRAAEYLAKSSWDPTGIVTFMEHMQQDERRRPQRANPGIFQTHPATEERIEAALAKLQSLGVTVDRHRTMRHLEATVVPVKMGNQAAAEIRIDSERLWVVGPSQDEAAVERAAKTATRLNEAFRNGTKLFQVSVRKASAKLRPAVVICGLPVIEVLPVDAEINKTNPDSLVAEWHEALRRVFWRQDIR